MNYTDRILKRFAQNNEPVATKEIIDDNPVYNPIKRKEEQEQMNFDMFKEYQKNINLSEQLRCSITKQIQSGQQDTYKLLIDAIKCISLMTGDTVFYNQNVDKLKSKEMQLNLQK